MEARNTPRRRASAGRLAVTLIAGLVLAGLVPWTAAAQTPASGPSAAERGIALTNPGVVFIDTSVKVKVVLTYNKPSTVSGLGHLDQTYSFDYATGSGFIVNPNGVVITASHVVEPDEKEMRNYAANSLILEGYDYSYPTNNSSKFAQYTLPVNYQNVLLQQCYKAIACDFTITPIVTVYSAVDIAQTQLSKGTPARVLASTGFENTDVAVLQVNGTNMPTVRLADTAAGLTSGAEITALGFPGSSRDALETGVTEPTKVFGHVSNIRAEGTSNLIEVDANIEPGMSGGPVIDADGKVIGLISFYLVQSTGEAGSKYLRTVDDMKTALASSGATVASGPVDEGFQTAMNLYWGSHFTTAVPEFERVLALYPGHPLATKYLADSQAKKGTAADVPVATTTEKEGGGAGFPTWAIAAIAGGAVVLILLIVLVTRRKKPAPAVAVVAAIAPPVSAVATQAAPAPEPGRSVGFQPTAPATPPPAEPEPVRAEAPASPQRGGEGAPEEPGATALFCQNCGHELQPGARFCASCGHTVG